MAVLLTAALVAGLNLPADADTRRVADADDASGELDMKWVAHHDGGVRAEMLDTETMDVIGHAKVWRPNRRSLVVQFPKRWLGRSLTRHRWAARTETYGDWCGQTADGVPPQHPDTAPDDGWILHEL